MIKKKFLHVGFPTYVTNLKNTDLTFSYLDQRAFPLSTINDQKHIKKKKFAFNYSNAVITKV